MCTVVSPSARVTVAPSRPIKHQPPLPPSRPRRIALKFYDVPLAGKEYEDVRAGALWLRERMGAEVQIGIKGLSYGGLNTLQAIARDSGLFAAGAANAPVFNWRTCLSGPLTGGPTSTETGGQYLFPGGTPTGYGFRQLQVRCQSL